MRVELHITYFRIMALVRTSAEVAEHAAQFGAAFF